MFEASIDPWVVLRVRSRHENTVENFLQQKAIHSFVPKYNVVRCRADRKVVVQLPLFPGYVFVQPRIDQYEKIRYIPGSCGLVFCGREPAIMPEEDLEAVKILVRSGVALAANPRLFFGQRVQVIRGPFMGIQGELIHLKNQQRVVINAQLLCRSVSVEVDLDAIEIL